MTTDTLDLGAFDDAQRAALRRLILTLADSKRLMGVRYSDWLLGAPSIEAGIAASSMAQDEWGHSRLLYSMLKDLGDDPVQIEHDRQPADYASVGALDVEFPDWAAVIAGMVVVDTAISVALDGFARGGYESARGRVPKMLNEEEFHWSLGAAWYRRLAGASDEARALLENATLSMLPSVLAWLGADDAAAQAMADAGVTDSGAERIAAFSDRVREILSVGGVDVDAVNPAAEWDTARGRGPGSPDKEAIERVRGDHNRALFVE